MATNSIPPTGGPRRTNQADATDRTQRADRTHQTQSAAPATVSRLGTGKIEIALASGIGIILTPPADSTISIDDQVTAIQNAMTAYQSSTVAETAGNLVALRNQLEATGFDFSDADMDKISVLLGQRTPAQNKASLQEAFDDIDANGGTYTSDQLAAINGDPNSNVTKMLNGQLPLDKATQKDFSIFTLLLLLSRLNNDQYNSMSQLSRDSQINIQLQFDKKKDTITEQANSKFGFAIAGVVAAGAMQIGGAGYALGKGGPAAASIGQLAGQIGGTIQQTTTAVSDLIQAGYQVELTDIEKSQSQSNYIKENAEDYKRRLAAQVDSNYDTAKEITRSKAEAMRDSSRKMI